MDELINQIHKVKKQVEILAEMAEGCDDCEILIEHNDDYLQGINDYLEMIE
jgi:hypothetical protein